MKSPSPFRWVGSKARILPIIKEYLPPKPNNYFEPFLGGGALFFDYGYQCLSSAFLQDINHALINTYDSIQSDFSNLVIKLDLLKAQTKDLVDNASYLLIRNRFNTHKKALEDYHSKWSDEDATNYAALFIALNHMCFNGLYRENKLGQFNVPIGTDSKGVARSLSSLDTNKIKSAFIKLAGKSTINTSCFPFHPWFLPITPKKGDILFYDPPFLKEFSAYSKEGFNEQQHQILYDQAVAIAKDGATVVLCGANNEPTKSIYGQPTREIEFARTVGASNRGKAKEALWVWNAYENQV